MLVLLVFACEFVLSLLSFLPMHQFINISKHLSNMLIETKKIKKKEN